MTNRIRCEQKAIEFGATILESTDTVVKIQSANGKMITTNYFDEEGNLIDWETEYIK